MSRHSSRRKQRRPYGHSSKQIGNCPLGRIEVNPNGYGFVETDEGTFFVPANRMGGAMNGDTVEVRPRHQERGAGRRQEAAVVRVHKRAVEYVVGRLEIADPLAVVVVDDPRIQHDVFVDLRECPDAHAGDVVLARITSYPTRRSAATGYIVEKLGRADAPGMDVDFIIHPHGLKTEFSPQALEQAEQIKLDIEGALTERGRHDLRERQVFTIDPADAKDFDDAISLDHVEGLTRLGVHIADVSAYVPWDSSIDICARDRGCSVYLADRVLPMLPEQLSCDICSLRPGQDRLTMTCDLYLDGEGILRKYQIHPTVIRSSRRFSYEQAQEILDMPLDECRDPLAPKLHEFNDLAQALRLRRLARGALDFDRAEAKPVLDDDGNVLSIALRKTTPATSMIEEAMILANETVAAHMLRKKIPCVYRIHEAPRAKSLEELLVHLRHLGCPIEGLASGNPQAYQQVLAYVEGRPEQELVNQLVLRSMERARYSTQPQPHFGLASKHYCHFTSPIRRYPDLMVHRLLKDEFAMEGQLDWLAEHASKMERIAEAAEDDSVQLKICEYLAPKVGETFVATITSVVAYGFFAQLENTAEGFVRFDEVRDEYHQFDVHLQTLMGEESGRTYRIGQQVKVRLKAVDLRDRHIDFALA